MSALEQLTALDLIALLILALLGLIWLAARLATAGRASTRAPESATADPVQHALHPQTRYLGPGQPARALALLDQDAGAPESLDGDLRLLDPGTELQPEMDLPADPAAMPVPVLRRPSPLFRPLTAETLAADLQPFVLLVAALFILAALVLRILSLLL